MFGVGQRGNCWFIAGSLYSIWSQNQESMISTFRGTLCRIDQVQMTWE